MNTFCHSHKVGLTCNSIRRPGGIVVYCLLVLDFINLAECYVELPFIFGHVFQADESNRDNETEYVEKSGDREKRKQIKLTRH